MALHIEQSRTTGSGQSPRSRKPVTPSRRSRSVRVLAGWFAVGVALAVAVILAAVALTGDGGTDRPALSQPVSIRALEGPLAAEQWVRRGPTNPSIRALEGPLTTERSVRRGPTHPSIRALEGPLTTERSVRRGPTHPSIRAIEGPLEAEQSQ